MKKVLVLVAFAVLLVVAANAAVVEPADRFKLVNISDPQFAPDGRSIVAVVSRANVKDDRYDSELVLVDAASGDLRPITFDRRGLASPRWSPDGRELAFLANASAEKEAKRQIWIMPFGGGDARRVTNTTKDVQQFAWSPDGSQIALVTSDEPVKKDEGERHDMAFEVGDDDFLVKEAPMPSHVWVVSTKGGAARRVTSGSWTLPVAHPPGPVPSPLSWSPDAKQLAISRVETPHSGNGDTSRIELVDVATGADRRVTANNIAESQPVFSPDGRSIAFWHPLGGERLAENHIWVTSPSGGNGRDATAAVDHNLFRAIWFPDSKSFLTGGHDGATTALWIQPLGGRPAASTSAISSRRGRWIDAAVSSKGAIAFTASTPASWRELYVMDTPESKPRRLRASTGDRFAAPRAQRSDHVEDRGLRRGRHPDLPAGFRCVQEIPARAVRPRGPARLVDAVIQLPPAVVCRAGMGRLPA